MIIENRKHIQLITDRVQEHAKSAYQGNDLGVFNQFISLYFVQSPAVELERRSVAQLYGMVCQHWRLLQDTNMNNSPVGFEITNPVMDNHGWDSTHTVLQLVTSDMPFLVDSIRMELERMGMVNYLMIYTGGIRVERSVDGVITNVMPRSQENQYSSTIEAPIHVEIGCVTNPDTLKVLRDNIFRVLSDVRLVTQDWRAMEAAVTSSIELLEHHPESVEKEDLQESISYLRWLLDDHFIFFGMRDYDVRGEGKDKMLRLVSGSGLGVLRVEDKSKKARYFHELNNDVQKMMLSKKHILVITKTNTQSTVHRSGYTDYIGIKSFDSEGNLVSERRIVGLYTSSAYGEPPESIPLLRRKVEQVLSNSGFPLRSHAGKDLIHILRTLPRDDLFQASLAELLNLSLGILHLQERKQIRLFARQDVYGRFVSCIVFIPRDRFSTGLISKMREILLDAFSGTECSFTTHFSTSALAQIHYVVRLNGSSVKGVDFDGIESRLKLAGQSWEDLLSEHIMVAFDEEKGHFVREKYQHAFQAGYMARFEPKHAVDDIKYIEKLSDSNELQMNAYRVDESHSSKIGLKLYRLGATVPLSDALPMLENLGLRVIGEEPYQLSFSHEEDVWINDLHMECKKDVKYDFKSVRDLFQDSFYQVWLGNVENDPFNSLTLDAGLSWRKILVLRAYSRYLKQIKLSFSTEYIAETMKKNENIVCLLMELFLTKFSPECQQDVEAGKLERLRQQIMTELESVKVLDEDRILRKYLHVIMATVRTNYFQLNCDGESKPYLSFKINPSIISDFPQPVPYSEIFVYSARFEGVHIRFDKVARGGLRWSNRREDYRTEVLGLSKAQQVKNSIIVPAGAKGGFVPKKLPAFLKRDEFMQEGVACYKLFINGLLDCVDNLQVDEVVFASNTIRYDEPDPYLVVAADKGTATFSDYANAVSLERDFWLRDAFASGGITGYDHKKIGITARGAWVSAQRHFQEMGVHLDETEVTVVGIGDMAGDVFGNGLLMSNKIKLVAAFNHMHIFLDPNPDSVISFKERERLFKLPRSSWMDYDQKLISKGGAIFSRSDKKIVLSSQVQKLLSVEQSEVVPSELIKLILRADVDMIWNGGIGTFVKSSNETNADAGDRGNDSLRINADELRAKVFCEGGNLGLTQRARIEFAQRKGNINTDFIDNSAGVDCSDHEVNLKVMLNSVVDEGDIGLKERNQLLKKMTDHVAVLVLQNNYQQNRLISMTQQFSSYYMSLYISFMRHYQKTGDIDLILDCLPDEEELSERVKSGVSFYRPEICVLVSHAKIILEKKLRTMSILEDDFYQSYALQYFPLSISKGFKKNILSHRLYREILSTRLSNLIVTDMGLAYVYQMEQELSISVDKIVNAYLIARDIFSLDELHSEIQSHDHTVATVIQHEMSETVSRLIRRSTRWLLHYDPELKDMQEIIDKFKPYMHSLYKKASQYLLGEDKRTFEHNRERYLAASVSEKCATKIALLPSIYHGLVIIDSSSKVKNDVATMAKVYFKIIQRFDLIWLRDVINSHSVSNRWVALAKANCKIDLDRVQSLLSVAFINFESKAKTLPAKMKAWLSEHEEFVSRWDIMLQDLKLVDSVNFAMLTVALKELLLFAESC